MTIIYDLGIESYHRADAISNSKLNVFRKSPLLYKKQYIDKSLPAIDTKAFKLGRAVDSLIFDGRDSFAAEYVVRPATYTASDGTEKKWHAQSHTCQRWEATQTLWGKAILTPAEHIKCEQMLQAVIHHPLAAALLEGAIPQVTFRRHSERFNLDLQGRPDLFNPKPIDRPDLCLTFGGKGYQVDGKSTRDFGLWFDHNDPTSPRQGRPVWEYGYHRQAGLAQWLAFQDVGETAHFLIVYESVEPFRVGVIQLDHDYLDMGWRSVESDLKLLSACKLANQWPGSVDRVIHLSPPQWLMDQGVREACAAAEMLAPAEEMAEVGS